jgi:TIR domain-containing protein
MSDQGNYRYDVFISYSHADRTWVWEKLLPRLEQVGLRVCIDDRDFEIGTPSLVNMERAAKTSKHTLAVLTPAWVESEWTEFESLLVGVTGPAARRRRLLPLMLKACDLPDRIATLTYADFVQPPPNVDPFERLLGQLQNDAAPLRPITQPDSSPFIVGPPITHPRYFFGRERELKRLFGLWRGLPLQNAAIIGPRRSGKTSLLWYIKTITTTPPEQLRPGQRRDWLPQSQRYRWIFVDFQDPRLHHREGLLRYLLNSLDIPLPTPCDLDHFIDVTSRRLRTPTVILLDEIGVALRRCPELDNDFWEGLRSLAINQVEGNLAFVMAAHESPQ